MVKAGEGEGFDPTQISEAVEDAGFGPGKIWLRAHGTLALHEDLLVLKLPTAPGLLILAGGQRFDELRASGPPVGSRIRAEGQLHPSHADQPPGMEVEDWTELENPDAPGAGTAAES